MTATAVRRSSRARTALVVAAVVVGLVLVAIIGGDGGDDGGRPLSGTATRPEGAAATVLLLRELGADVTVTHDVDALERADSVLVLRERLSAQDRRAVDRWVEEGGRLVVADPESALTPLVDAAVDRRRIDRGVCTIDALADTNALVFDDDPDIDEIGPDLVDLSGMLVYDVPAGSSSCFGSSRRAAIVATRAGDGAVVAVGGPAPFVNGYVGRRDNAVMAAALLAPTGDERVVFLEPAPGAGGDDTLFDLTPGPVKAAILQLAVAFVLYAVWRARRLGAPVLEPVPVVLPGSELVRATGELLHQRRAPSQASDVLAADLRRSLATALGLARDAPVATIADAATARFGVERERVIAALERRPGDDAALVEHAREIEQLRQEVFHGSHATA